MLVYAQPFFLLHKLGSDSSPSNILGDTSSAPHMLLDRVKPIWVGAQGDHCGKGVNKERTPVDGSMSTIIPDL